MAWKCPACKATNDDKNKKCGCGFAYYEVLGVKPDASAETVGQTYEYLLNVWKTSGPAADPQAKAKSAERLKKINDAYAIFRHFHPVRQAEKKSAGPRTAIIAGSAIVVLIAGIVIYMSMSGKEPEQTRPAATVPSGTGRPDVPDVPEAARPSARSQEASPGTSSSLPDMSAEKSEEWAIESVRKSNALDRIYTVEVLMEKWAEEHADKFKAVGWMAKQAEDDAYVVSYTLTDGINTKGFYFELNTGTGKVRNLAAHPDLQKKYGISPGQ